MVVTDSSGVPTVPDEIENRRAKRGVCLPVRSRSTLASLRIVAGLTQGELADRAGVSAESVSNWERGRNEPQYRHALAIADALGCDVRLVFPTLGSEREERG